MTLKEFIDTHYHDCINISKNICQTYNLCNVAVDIAHNTFTRLLSSTRVNQRNMPFSEWKKFFVIQLHNEYKNYYNRTIKRQFKIEQKLFPFVETAIIENDDGTINVEPITYDSYEGGLE